MNIQLIQGEFSASDALALVTQLVNVKIKYHEGKIERENEEDTKFRESKIKRLQKELYEWREGIHAAGKPVKIEALIKVE